MCKTLFFVFSLLLVFAPFNAANGENVAQGVKTIIIDAGHGGMYPGARYGNVCEKDINLKVAKRLGAMITKGCPGVKVVYTRTVEKHFSTVLRTDLQQRADIANGADGDLFISIHANAARNTSIRGVETLIMGESNLEKSVNDAILFANNKEEFLDMSDEKTAAIVRAHIQNMQFTYGEYSEMMARLIQKHYVQLGRSNRGVRKQPLRVLYATDMPSVLTEIGFMSNPTELKYITSEKGQTEIANAIYCAVKEYIAFVNKTTLVEDVAVTTEPKETTSAPASTALDKPATSAQPAASAKPQEKSAVAKTSATESTPVRYAIQIMASGSQLSLKSSAFKSYRGKVRMVRSSGRFAYKYCTGDYADKTTAQAALKSVRREFPPAFVVAVKDGRVVSGK